MLTESFMTLMNASSNRSNHNRSAKEIKETKKCHSSPVNSVNLDSSIPMREKAKLRTQVKQMHTVGL
jgi:hypothetical protein